MTEVLLTSVRTSPQTELFITADLVHQVVMATMSLAQFLDIRIRAHGITAKIRDVFFRPELSRIKKRILREVKGLKFNLIHLKGNRKKQLWKIMDTEKDGYSEP